MLGLSQAPDSRELQFPRTWTGWHISCKYLGRVITVEGPAAQMRWRLSDIQRSLLNQNAADPERWFRVGPKFDASESINGKRDALAKALQADNEQRC